MNMHPHANLGAFLHPPKNGTAMKPMPRPARMPSRVPLAPKMPPVKVNAQATPPPSLGQLLGVGGPGPVMPKGGMPPSGNKTVRRAPRGRKPAMRGTMPGMGGY